MDRKVYVWRSLTNPEHSVTVLRDVDSRTWQIWKHGELYAKYDSFLDAKHTACKMLSVASLQDSAGVNTKI